MFDHLTSDELRDHHRRLLAITIESEDLELVAYAVSESGKIWRELIRRGEIK